MNAAELRIGNWVKPDWQEKPIQVTAKMIIEQFQCNLVGTPYLSPIPLSDCVLLAAKFEKSISLDGDEIMQLPHTNFYIEWMEFAIESEKGFYYYCESLSNHKKINSVNELQNLVFALFGFELWFDFSLVT